MQLGDLILNISSFFGSLWSWVLNLFSFQFQLGGLTITMWQIFAALGVAVFVAALIINFIS